jgi:hypothetical protein
MCRFRIFELRVRERHTRIQCTWMIQNQIKTWYDVRDDVHISRVSEHMNQDLDDDVRAKTFSREILFALS